MFVIFGNVLLNNELNGEVIYFILMIGMVGLIKYQKDIMISDFKYVGDVVYVLGIIEVDFNGSEL